MMMKRAKSELKTRPSHPPLAGRLLFSSLRSIITKCSDQTFSHYRSRYALASRRRSMFFSAPQAGRSSRKMDSAIRLPTSQLE